MINVYDFEVFKHDWMVVIVNPETREENVIINDVEKLKKYYEKHKNEIWVGFNSKNYDQYILKGLLLNMNPKEINDWIVVENKAGWQYSSMFRDIQLFNYDVMVDRNYSLKQLEGFIGDNIKETSVPFDLDRKLTQRELDETVKYCRHDVMETLKIFMLKDEDFISHMNLIKAFNLNINCINKTKAQMISLILGANKKSYDDEFDIKFPHNLKIEKYIEVLDWYKNKDNRKYNVIANDVKSAKNQLKINIAGVPHVFGWGGVHGAISKYKCEGLFVMIDVASLYPSLMINYNYHSRSIKDPNRFVDIYNTNLKMKKEKNPLRPAYKLTCNTTYGCMKDKNNALYDPQMANNVCVAGQLLLLDLIEKIEDVSELIQLT